MTSHLQRQNTAVRPLTSRPEPIGADLWTRLSIAHNQVQAGEPIEDRTRHDLAARLSVLNASLADRRPVEESIVTMIAAMSVGKMTKAEAIALAALYESAVADRPAWAVIRAADLCSHGHGPSGTFLPNVPEFVGAVDGQTKEIFDERAKISRVLGAKATSEPRKPRTPEEQQRAGELVDRLMAQFNEARAETQLQEQARQAEKPVNAWIEEYHRDKETDRNGEV